MVVLAGAALGGCGSGGSATTTVGEAPHPATSTWLLAPSGVPTVSEAVPTAEPDGSPPGTTTCGELGAAIRAASLMQPGVVDRIVATSATADAPVGDAAHRLAAAYAAAVKSKGTAQEPDATAAVSASAADMDGICTQSGLESAG